MGHPDNYQENAGGQPMEESHRRRHVIRPSIGVSAKDFYELWAYRDLVLIFVQRDIATRYRQTLVGPIWLWLQAIFMTGAIALVGQIAFNDRVINLSSVIFTMLGYMVWSYSNQTISQVAYVFHAHGYLFSKVYFPRLAIPLAICFSQIVGLAIQSVVVITLILSAYFLPGNILRPFGFLAVIPGICIMLPFSLGIGLIIASASAKYRDLSNATPFLLQFLLFVTPVIYGFGDVDPSLRTVLAILNPLSVVSDLFRAGAMPMSSTVVEIMLATVSSFSIAIVGLLWFQRMQRTVVDIL